MSGNDIVRLTTSANPQEAYLLRDMLREQNIECRVVGDMLDAGLGDVPGIRPELWVFRDDLPLASKLIEEHEQIAAISDEADEMGVVSP